MARPDNHSEQHLLPHDPPDPRNQIQARIQSVCATIDQKRRYLLRSDRAFVRENIRQLQGAIANIIQILDGSLMLPSYTEIRTEEPPPIATHSSPATLPLVQLAGDPNPILPNAQPQQRHIHQYLVEEQGTSLETVIRTLRTVFIPNHEPISSEPLSENEFVTTIQLASDTSSVVDESQILSELATLEAQLDLLVELQHWPPTTSWQIAQNLSLQPLWQEIEQATHCIESLMVNARLEVARSLNQLKILLGRIHRYSNTHGILYVKRWGWYWGLPSGALLSAIDQVDLAVSDAEWGSRCSLLLLQDTEIAISRLMYRYEYGLPFKWPMGWVINRINDGKRLIMSVKQWHDSDDRKADSTTIKSKVLLGLGITSLFWIFLFLTVSGLTIIARVGIAVLTPSSVQQKVEKDNDAIGQVTGKTEDQLALYQARLKENLAARIDDKNELIERSLSSINYVIDNSLAPIIEQVEQVAVVEAPSSTTLPSSATNTTAIIPASTTTPTLSQTTTRQPGTTSTSTTAQNPAQNQVQSSPLQKLAIACQFDIQPLITEANRLACSQALSAAQTALEQDNLDLYQTAIEDISDILDVLTRNLNNIATYIAERNSLQDQNATIDENFINTAEELITLIESLQPASQTQSPNSEANTFVIQIWRTLFSWSKDDVFNGNLNRIMLALLAGAIGSVISLLMRLNDLEPRQLSAPFLLGLFQPLIGAVTSVVVVAILSTDAVDVINIFPEQLQLRETREAVEPSVTTGTEGTGATAIRATRSNPVGRLDTHEVYKILIIGFFVGFSERLAKDTLGKLNTGRLG